MKGLRLVMLLFVVAGMAPLAVLGWFASVSLAREEAQAVGETERKEEAALAAVRQRWLGGVRDLVRRETEREFTQFQHWYAPLNIQSQAPSVVPSPLAATPDDKLVKYYFQIRSDGADLAFSSPHQPEPTGYDLEQYQQIQLPTVDLQREIHAGGDEIMAELDRMLASAPSTVAPANLPKQAQKKITDPAVPGKGGTALGEEPTARKAVLARSGDHPVAEQTLLNEVLLVNFNSRLIATNAAREQQTRVNNRTYGNGNDNDSWNALTKNPELDPAERSQVRVFPYCLYVGGTQQQPITLLWRTVQTPVNTLMQGLVLDTAYATRDWLPAQIEPGSPVRLGAEGLSVPDKLRGTVLDPNAADFDARTETAFGALPLSVNSEAGALRARFEQTRGHYVIVAAGYLSLLTLLGLLLVRTVNRHSALVRQQQDFLAAVSHELRTPLSAMRLYTELAQQQAEAVQNESLIRHTERILNEEDRLTRIVEMLLLSARIERGSLTLEPVVAPLGPALEQAAELAQRNHPGREIRLPQIELPEVRMDRAAATQLFANLIDNGLKYSRETGKPVSVGAATADGALTLSVRDEGCGIGASDLARLFTRFYRGQKASMYGAGTGLGLWLCKTYADAMGWKLDVTSEVGKGTCISVRIPLKA